MFQFDLGKLLRGGITLSAFHQISQLDNKLTDTFPLDEYLEEEDAIQCAKDMGTNAKKYFKDGEKIKTLIKYITVEPEHDEHLRGHKFPYVASEILKCDNGIIQDYFALDEKEYMEAHPLVEPEEIDAAQNKLDGLKSKLQEVEKEIDNIEKEEKSIKEEGNNSSGNSDDTGSTDEKSDKEKKEKNDKEENKGENKEEKKEENKEAKKEENKEERKEENKEENKEIKKEENKEEKKEENKEVKKEENTKNEDKPKNENVEKTSTVESLFNISVPQKKPDDITSDILPSKESEDSNQKITENLLKENESKTNPYLDLLLEFVMSDKQELNYVLASYFSNLMIALLDKYPSRLIQYLFSKRKDAVKQIVLHSHQKALSTLALKILKIENFLSPILIDIKKNPDKFNSMLILKTIEEGIEFRNELLCDIIKSVDLNGMKDKIGNNYNYYDIEGKFSLLFESLTDNRIITTSFIENKEIYYHICDILSTDVYDKTSDNKKYYIYQMFLRLATSIIGSILSTLKEGYELPKEYDYNSIYKKRMNKENVNFNELILFTFENVLRFNFDERKPKIIIEERSNMPYEGLGYLNYYVMDFIFQMFPFMKQIPSIFDDILIKSNFVQKSVVYFFKYQWNNMYHLKFTKLIKLYLEEESKHTNLTKFLFNNIKLHEKLLNFLSEDEQKSKKDPKLKFTFKSGRTTNSGVYPYVIDLIYKLQVVGGLDTFNDQDKNSLNIKQLGEFEFLRDEKTKNESNSINKSDIIGAILKSTKNWEKIFKEKILPLLKKYEGKLCREGEGKNVIDNAVKPLANYGALLQKLINMIKGDKPNVNNTNQNTDNKTQITNILDKENLLTKKYNDSNYWDIKNNISNGTKIEENKKEVNKEIDEEEELLGICKKLEQNEKTEKYKKIGTGVKNLPKIKFDNLKNKKSNLQMTITSNAEKIGGNGELSNQLEEKNEKILTIPEEKKAKIKVPETLAEKEEYIKKFINKTKKDKENKDKEDKDKENKDKENKDKENKDNNTNNTEVKGKEKEKEKGKEKENKSYNDINYWDVNPGSALNKDEIDNCLKDLL